MTTTIPPSTSEDRSPSPPPQAPTATTPGPRATQFNKLCTDALASTLRAISYDSFADCFPTIAQQAPNSLRQMYQGFIEHLEKFALDEFQQIQTERSLIPNLNKLDDLILSAKARKSRSVSSSPRPPIPPHTLPASEIMKAHLQPVQTRQQSEMNAKIQTLQGKNAVLGERLGEQRREVEELVGMLEGVVRDLEGAGVVLGERGGELSGEAMEMEGVLGGV